MAFLERWADWFSSKNTARKFVPIRRELVIADPLPGIKGYTWTLASFLGDLLAAAQVRFGDRDITYCFLGVEFNITGPRIWFPGDKNHIVIQLSLNSLSNGQTAMFELANECVHLLSPCSKIAMSVLEEGLAATFSIDIMERYHGKGWWSNCNNNSDYFAAAIQVRSLLALDNDIIKKLRQEEPRISSITSEMILRNCPLVSEALAQSLTSKFIGAKNTIIKSKP